nr:ankyrin repeat-containing protein [Tanacetum cinerariifolium]
MTDYSKNNLLHLVGKMAPSYVLSHTTGAALQLQQELQWREEVKKFMEPVQLTDLNIDNETPEMVFTREHESLVKDGEKWMKATAESCSITAALIVTIVFAAAITVPGGSNQETEDDDDLDLFGDDTEEEKAAAEAGDQAKASTKKKESGKSSVLMDVEDQVSKDDNVENIQTISDSQSDTFWEQKVPNDYENILNLSKDSLQWTTKKELYSILKRGFLINNGQQWLSVDKNGKKCLTLSARATWVIDDKNSAYESSNESRNPCLWALSARVEFAYASGGGFDLGGVSQLSVLSQTSKKSSWVDGCSHIQTSVTQSAMVGEAHVDQMSGQGHGRFRSSVSLKGDASEGVSHKSKTAANCDEFHRYTQFCARNVKRPCSAISYNSKTAADSDAFNTYSQLCERNIKPRCSPIYYNLHIVIPSTRPDTSSSNHVKRTHDQTHATLSAVKEADFRQSDTSVLTRRKRTSENVRAVLVEPKNAPPKRMRGATKAVGSRRSHIVTSGRGEHCSTSNNGDFEEAREDENKEDVEE